MLAGLRELTIFLSKLLDYDWVSHMTSTIVSGTGDLVPDCNLLALMHSVLRRQYNSSAPTDPSENLLGKLKQLNIDEHCLKDWLECHPMAISLDQICDLEKFTTQLGSSTTIERRRLLRVFFQYHNASLFIFCPWIDFFRADCANDDVGRHGASIETASWIKSHCVETCLKSALALIHISSELTGSFKYKER